MTYVQAKKSKEAAEKSQAASEVAKEATNKLRKDIKRVNILSDLTYICEAIENIRGLFRKKDWDSLLERYPQLRNSIAKIYGNNEYLNETDEKFLDDLIKELTQHENLIEMHLMNDQNEVDHTVINLKLSTYSTELYKIKNRINNTIGS